MQRVIVIGAGVSGLAAASKLAEHKDRFAVTVLESRDRLGGRIFQFNGATWIHSCDSTFNPFLDFETFGLRCGPLEQDQFETPVFWAVDEEKQAVDVSDAFEAVAAVFEQHVMRDLEEKSKGIPDGQKVKDADRDPGLRAVVEQLVADYHDKFVTAVSRCGVTMSDCDAMVSRLVDLCIASLESYNACKLEDSSFHWFYDEEVEDETRSNRFCLSTFEPLVEMLAAGLDVRLSTVVQKVERSTNDGQFQVTTEKGEEFVSDIVIVTVPLGVLKAASIKFVPQLQDDKLLAIQRTHFGIFEKVFLRFEACFWQREAQWIGFISSSSDGSRNEEKKGRTSFHFNWFLNMAMYDSNDNTLVAFVANDTAKFLEELSEEEVIGMALRCLQCMFKANEVDVQKHFKSGHFTRWSKDPFSRGSYSIIGRHGTAIDLDVLARPALGGTLRFAGEHTCREASTGYVHGAYLSGLREAQQLIKSQEPNKE